MFSFVVFIMFVFGVLGAKTHAKQQLRSLQTACKLFAVPFDVTTFDLQTGFVEFDASAAPIPVVSYEIDISPLNAGFPWPPVSWTLYGSESATAPVDATDPTWVSLDVQSGVDFSVPQTNGTLSPFAFVYPVANPNATAYSFFAFVVLPPAAPVPITVAPVLLGSDVQFC